jgi:hypothetical protein
MGTRHYIGFSPALHLQYIILYCTQKEGKTYDSLPAVVPSSAFARVPALARVSAIARVPDAVCVPAVAPVPCCSS